MGPDTAKNIKDAVDRKKVCTQQGFTYPKLEKYFESGLANRIDSSSEEISFNLLLRGRCHYVATNEFVADAIIEKNSLGNRVYRSTFLVDQSDFVFAFHPKHQRSLTLINHHISEFIASGQMSEVIDYHRQKAVELANRFVGPKENTD